MLSEKIKQIPGTLAFRLNVYYTALFTLSALVALLVIYLLISEVLSKNVDEDLLQDVREFSLLLSNEGPEALLEELSYEAEKEDPQEFFFRLFTGSGEEILVSELEPWPELQSPLEVVKLISTNPDPVYGRTTSPYHEHAARIIHAELAPDYFLQLAETNAENAELMEIIVSVFSRTLLLILLLGGVTGWYMARRALAGVEEVTDTAKNISKGDFSLRVPLKSRGQEVERLATTFNSMLDRIHALIAGIREVTDNIAHDLRGPITSIRGTAETTLMHSPDLADYQSMAGNTIEECDRLLGMINAMLDISEAEAGAEKLERKEIDLSTVVRQAGEIFQPLADEHRQSLAIDAPQSCIITGDIKKIQRLIANLIDNALKYTHEEGRIEVTVRCDGEDVQVRVDDNGLGIAQNDIAHIFERFYRCDQSRSHEGTGLGLCLARAIARAHNGKLEVSSALGKGSSFFLTIPKSVP